jgi:HlyD family secretion protein
MNGCVMWRCGPGLACALALFAGCSADPPPTYQGYVEGEYVHMASPLGGRLERLQVQRGQTIVAGAPLFKLEAVEEAAAKQQADDQLKAAQAQLADLRLGRRAPELDVVRAQLAQAQAAEAQAAQQLQRDEAQYQAGGIARAQVDDGRTNLAMKSARVRELADQLQVSRLPARGAQIRAQDALVAAARAVAEQQAWRLGQKQVAATQAGLVVDTLYRDGEWVPAGSPVVRLLPPGNLKLRFFVPETVVGTLQPGRKLALQCDGCATGIGATVSYIADAPEYTPPVIYSNETRAKLVFMVEASPAPPHASALRPGQPVTVTLQ